MPKTKTEETEDEERECPCKQPDCIATWKMLDGQHNDDIVHCERIECHTVASDWSNPPCMKCKKWICQQCSTSVQEDLLSDDEYGSDYYESDETLCSDCVHSWYQDLFLLVDKKKRKLETRWKKILLECDITFQEQIQKQMMKQMMNEQKQDKQNHNNNNNNNQSTSPTKKQQKKQNTNDKMKIK